jgi:hypothetical protein
MLWVLLGEVLWGALLSQQLEMAKKQVKYWIGWTEAQFGGNPQAEPKTGKFSNKKFYMHGGDFERNYEKIICIHKMDLVLLALC